MFGATKYNEKIDIWAAACVVAELIKLQPLFPGKSAKTQIHEVFRVLGTPTEYEVKSMNKNYSSTSFPQLDVLPFETNFPALVPDMALDFLQMCLVYDPKQRPDAIEVLQHPFFEDLKGDRVVVAPGVILPDKLFDFTDSEYTMAGKLIEEHLLPDYLPKNWMGYVNRIF
jgi:serine/threonine protein kinase